MVPKFRSPEEKDQRVESSHGCHHARSQRVTIAAMPEVRFNARALYGHDHPRVLLPLRQMREHLAPRRRP